MIIMRHCWLIVMPLRERVEEVLRKAKELEKKYDWGKAAALYEQALRVDGKKDFVRKGEIEEKAGYCFYRAAFQADTQEEFIKHMQLAVGAYKKAVELFERVKEAKRSSAKILNCRAMVAYIAHWLSPNPDAKRKVLDECWRLGKEALKAYDKAGDQPGLGRTCVGLANCLADRLDLEWDTQMRERIIDEALSIGEKAIQIFSKAGDEHELAKAYCITSILYFDAALSLAAETKRRKCEQKAFDYAKNAIRIVKDIGDKLLLARSTIALGFAELDLGAGSEVASELFRKAVQYGIETKDHHVLSGAFDGLASSTCWSMIFEEDLEKIREKSRLCEEYASEAIGCSILANYGLGIPHSYSFGYIENFGELARREINLEARHKFLDKAIALGKQGLAHAQHTGSTHAIFHVSYGLVQALYYLSTIKTGVEKRRLLEEAMTLGEKLVYYTEQLRPHYMLPQAWSYNALALILFEISKLEESGEKRKELLEKSISRMEDGITILERHVTSFPSRRELFAWLSRFYAELGNILNQLYQTTSEEKVLKKLIEAYQRAVQVNRKADLFSRVAEAYWQIAKTYDQLAEYPESARNFKSASKNYRIAAEKMPQLKGFYSEYALYMRAWAELEKARREHENENYAEASERYRTCSRSLEKTKRWSYLSSYYFAWSLLERGEDLSRLDRPQDAMKIFDEAMRIFGDSVNSLRRKARELESSEEKAEASKLATIAGLRRQYCMGRVLMEEAKLSNRKGDKMLSAEKYSEAARIFEGIATNLEGDEARMELQFAATLCRAWENMELAEERGDPLLYGKAAKLFAKAGQISRRKTARLVAVGNSCFCEALRLGMKFMVTSKMDFYSGAKLQMESAASYYRRAGFEKPALWVEATKRLLDAYVYAGKAEAEAEPEKRVRFYLMAEKCLELSAKLYGKAGYLNKENEALENLERIRKERELALSLSEVLTVPAILSSLTGISMPDSTEKPAGLNNFEFVNIRAHLSVPKKFIPGEEFQVKLDLVNVGKKSGLLVRVEGLVPRRCKVLRVSSHCILEGDSLNMKGKRLDPLSVESVSVWVQVKEMTAISLSPRVVYVDEQGNFRTIKVEEVTILPIVEFESKEAMVVFNYLIDAFVKDSVKRRLSTEKSGWRSLPQIIKETGVPKRSLYGPSGRLGTGLSELQRKGLIDLRAFHGERGRGGHILKVRVHHKKELVRRYAKEKAPNLSF